MSPAMAVLFVVFLLTLNGLGVLAVIGLAGAPRELMQQAAIAPLAGMAWAGVVGATLATVGSRLGAVELVVLAVLTCAAGGVRKARRPSRRQPFHRSSPRTRFELGASVAALLALTIVLIAAIALFHVKPIAEYDGWAMWGMKARAIAVLGAADPDVFASSAYARLHLEYPLLLPALHALPLQAADRFESNVVILSCLSIGLAGLLAVWGLLRERVRPAVLLAFIAAIATAPAFFGQLSTGYADIPVAMFVAAGVVAAARWLLDEEGAWLALATLFLAAAALTKNEGLLFAGATYVALFVAASGRRRTVALSALAVAIAYAPWKAYVAIHDLGAPDYDLSSSLNLPWVVGRLDRAPPAAEGLFRLATDGEQFGILLLFGITAIGVTLIVGPRSLGLLAAGFAGFSFAGLTWIYVLTPNAVSYFLFSNGNRIVVSLVIGLAALTPLLVEESTRALSDRRAADAASGKRP